MNELSKLMNVGPATCKVGGNIFGKMPEVTGRVKRNKVLTISMVKLFLVRWRIDLAQFRAEI